MKKFFSLVVILMSSTAFAGSINLDFRTDYFSQDYNEAATAASAGYDSNRFYVNTGRIDFKGNLNESVGYRVRWRFATKNQGSVDKRDNTNGTLDLAYIEHKVSDTFKLQFGKYLSEMGGYEGLTTGPDLYLTSEAYSGTAGLGGSTHTKYDGTLNQATSLTGHSTELYITGVKAIFTVGAHEVNIQAADVDANVGRGSASADSTTGAGANAKISQNDSLLGLVFKGNFMEKTLGMIASYHTQNNGADAKADYAALGFHYKADNCWMQLEYVMNTYKSMIGTLTPEDKLNSAIFTYKHMIDDNWSALLKYTVSEESLDAVGATAALKNKYSSYGVAAEWKPKKDDIFRYHLAYNAKNMKPETGDERKLQEVIAGVRINADFLK